MAFNYSPYAALVAAKLREFGAEAQLRDESGKNIAKTAAVFTVNTNAPKPESQVQDNAKELIVAATKVPPVIGWTVTVAGESFRVIEVEALKPASTVLYYKLKVAA